MAIVVLRRTQTLLCMTATFGPSVAAVVSLEFAAMWRSEMEHQFALHLKHTRSQSFREKYDVQTTFRRFRLSENDEFQNPREILARSRKIWAVLGHRVQVVGQRALSQVIERS